VASPSSTSDGRAVPGWPVSDVVIPALNERDSIALVLADIPAGRVREVIVVDNGSDDTTPEIAARHGATVIVEPRRGYGQACLAGIEAIASRPVAPDVVVFLDADYSDHPEELVRLVEPIAEDRADLVVGSRVRGRCDPGALLPQARFGNLLASWLIGRLYGLEVTDLGPFRAIRWPTLLELRMIDTNFGWTAEMQVKAARSGIRYAEVAVSYRKRIGSSKISGTLSGTLRAGWKILYTVFRYRPGR